MYFPICKGFNDKPFYIPVHAHLHHFDLKGRVLWHQGNDHKHINEIFCKYSLSLDHQKRVCTSSTCMYFCILLIKLFNVRQYHTNNRYS